ncbi:bifunctional lysine-specific demethylase and histidyl-hydroxylase NO66 [Ostrinia furnacalis]|uniref:bifunctional lysine-specific demethylase and histidyl-hydroxylase NO66 n=1 Tax=Ostrinia furnacalis TaxID=93504 RepID=UPI00103CCF1A|nr:bifunctional lysine-specific demethylase and histidyl-hydroxylase NO66 [Ostrinia furnacalis]
MDSPVSAFAMYNKNNKKKPSPVEKKKTNRKNKKNVIVSPKASSKNIPDSLMIEVAQKVKRQQKRMKEQKNIVKKKSHKKKKSKKSKENKVTKNNSIVSKRTQEDSESEDIPTLVPAPIHNFAQYYENGASADETCSHSSEGYLEFTPVQTDSVEEGLKVFKWMIAPYNPKEFLDRVWEKKPLHIARNKSSYYKEIISTPIIDNMLRNESIQFTKNIDVTSYVDEKRETHNPEGRAHPHLVWDFYLNGCSIRLLNPQTYIPKLHLLNATMQEYFNSFVGANAYLTPPDSQGFAPHYDDIEAFILQAEGKKHWRVYKPRSENEVLPRVSSKNFDQNEIGEPILEVTLEAGDMLYFPRGYIHQGVTIEGEHSLHVTVSMYQKHSWADLFERLIPGALELAINENVELRRGLPLDLYENFGFVNSNNKTPRRKQIEDLIKTLFDKIKDHLPIDEAVDQMNKNFQYDALPPVLSDLEKAVTVFGDSDVMIEDGVVTNRIEIGLDTKIRLLRKNILRMIEEEESIRLYYYVENSLEYHGNELSFIEIEEELAPAIGTLIESYPDYVSVENLEAPSEADRLQVADALWSRGLIMTEYPLDNIEDD